MSPLRFPQSDHPTVSVVVLLRAGVGLADRVLGAVATAHDPEIPAEVIVVVNTLDPDTREMITGAGLGAQAIFRDVNTGTAVGWNLGFEAARGRFVALLHEDSAPEAGWLRPLLATFQSHPQAAAVGSRLLHSDGSVQGGGIIAWNDGDVTWIKPENAPEVLERNEPYAISHASSAAMLVDKRAWDKVGGFDERYFPAFRVEVDFGLALWSMGRTVMSAPSSLVRHDLGAMHRGEFDPLKSRAFRWFLQERNRHRFLEKWSEHLALLAPPPVGPRNTPAALESVIDRLQACAEASRSERTVAKEASRPFTGFDLEDLDHRLEAAHREVQEEFFSWLVVDLERTRAELDHERAGSRRGDSSLKSLRAQVADRDSEVLHLQHRIRELEERATRESRPRRRGIRELLSRWVPR